MAGPQAEEESGNLLALAIDAARARATVGEISDALETVYGRYRAMTHSISGVYGAAYADDAEFATSQEQVEAFARAEGRRPRMLVSKLGQDGHDRGARVIALAAEPKHADVAALGAQVVLPRSPADLRAALGGDKITVVADVVGGPDWPRFIDMLERGGRYVCSGAIAGPMVALDLRTLYLRDLSFFGSTVLSPEVTRTLVRYIEAGDVAPALAATYPLAELHAAQTAFIAKEHTGNIVVCP